MQKIVSGVFKGTFENGSLIWLLFLSNILISYAAYSTGLVSSLPFAILFSILAVYILSSVLQGLVLYYVRGGWSWGQIFKGGLNNFFVMLLWILFSAVPAALFLLAAVNLSEEIPAIAGMWPLFFFCGIYIAGPTAVFLYKGSPVKKSIFLGARLIGRKTGTWLLCALFIIIILLLTGAAAELFTLLSLTVENWQVSLAGEVFLLAAEFVRAAATVVIMSTIIFFSCRGQDELRVE